MIKEHEAIVSPGASLGEGHAPVVGHPDDVLRDTALSTAEKRAILASWASDDRAVADAPALRQIDNGAVIHVDEILRALKALDREPGPSSAASRPRARRPRVIVLAKLRGMAHRFSRSDDDDDPPPCPSAAAMRIGRADLEAAALSSAA